MTLGLLIRDESGRVVLDPSTFTTRYVTTVYIPPGRSSEARRYSATGVTSAMFAVGCPLSGYKTVFGSDSYAGFPGEKFAESLPRMPALRVGDGWVEAYSPGGTQWDGNVQVLVFTRI